jgi:hypothetical protein
MQFQISEHRFSPDVADRAIVAPIAFVSGFAESKDKFDVLHIFVIANLCTLANK